MPKGRILAVDDQRYFRELLEGMLVEEGFEVQTASGGQEALRLLERSNFDVVLTDLVMPEMDGNELVHRVKLFDPDQDIVVVTGVVDVKTAVDSMKLGASEYLLKPFDRDTLASTLDGVLHRRRLRVEHGRLLDENIEYMGERTLIERAMALFSFLSIEPLAERIVDGLCVETSAQGGILWIVEAAGSNRLRLASARGLVRIEEEPEALEVSELPAGFLDGTLVSQAADERDERGNASDGGNGLLLVLRDESRVSGIVRLTDKLGGERFDAIDRTCAEKFVGFAQTALANANRFRALESRTLENTTTGAYPVEHFENAVRKEIEKSTRHGRTFSILKVAFTRLEGTSEVVERAYREWLADVVLQFSALQRSTDLVAFDGECELMALLPEADALGATLLKQRAANTFESVLAKASADGGPMAGLDPEYRPRLSLAVVTYPADGTQLESLMGPLDERVMQDQGGLVRELDLNRLPLAECFDLLLERGFVVSPDEIAKMGDLVLRESLRGSTGRTLLYASPGRMFGDAISAVLCGRQDLVEVLADMEVAVMSDEARPDDLVEPVTWVTSDGAGVAPFVIRFGDGPAYALVCDDVAGTANGRMFHTADRSLVEHLALRVQRSLA
jgi:two-component system cell cycle response regulator